MNERMLELAKQAGLRKEHASDREYIGNFDWRVFGDLIVRECAAKVDWILAKGGKTQGDVLKEHFGVEE